MLYDCLILFHFLIIFLEMAGPEFLKSVSKRDRSPYFTVLEYKSVRSIDVSGEEEAKNGGQSTALYEIPLKNGSHVASSSASLMIGAAWG